MNGLLNLWHVCTLSNAITIARIALIPSIIDSIKTNQWGMATVLFSIAAISDIADGYIARLFDQQTLFGAILDPVADKILLLACYITFVLYPNKFFTIPMWFLITMLAKELILLLGAGYYCLITNSTNIKPTFLGKLTMVLQSFFVGWLFISAYLNFVPATGVTFFLIIITCFALAALFQYIYIALYEIQ